MDVDSCGTGEVREGDGERDGSRDELGDAGVL